MSTGPSARLLAIVDALPLRRGLRVLEIGCGPGAAARDIARRIGDGHILAIRDRAPSKQSRRQGPCREPRSPRETSVSVTSPSRSSSWTRARRLTTSRSPFVSAHSMGAILRQGDAREHGLLRRCIRRDACSSTVAARSARLATIDRPHSTLSRRSSGKQERSGIRSNFRVTVGRDRARSRRPAPRYG